MKSVRIGAGLGFYGDSWRPVRASIESGGVQYIASDHLAELTLAILQKDRQKDPSAGYARDCVPMLTELWPLAAERGVKFVMNAGGLNPHGAREAVARAFREKGFTAKIAVVTGDSISDRIDELQSEGEALAHMDTGADIASVRERLLFANAYLGAAPIAEALAKGADIVITGRVADAALSLGPLMHELNWRWDDWDRLAQGLTVGHLLECSGQASGGNFGSAGEWAKVQNFLHLGYPIAEVSEDGSALLTKAPGTGGKVSFDTLRQQLLYEVHDPHAYYSPDVVLDMGTLDFDDQGNDAVRITGAGGAKRPDTLKVVAGYHDGWMGTGMIGFSWPDAYLKCETSANIIKGLVDGARLEAGRDQCRICRLQRAARRQCGSGAARQSQRMLPAHDGAHQGQAHRRRVRPAVSVARAFRAALCGRLQGRAGRQGIARTLADAGAPRACRVERQH